MASTGSVTAAWKFGLVYLELKWPIIDRISPPRRCSTPYLWTNCGQGGDRHRPRLVSELPRWEESLSVKPRTGSNW